MDNYGTNEYYERQSMMAMANIGSVILNDSKNRSHMKLIEEHCAKMLDEARAQTQYQERIAIALERIANK